jgi:nucleoid-associated protein YgaU
MGVAGGLRLVGPPGPATSDALPAPAVPTPVAAGPVAAPSVRAGSARPVASRLPVERDLPARGTAGHGARGGGCATPVHRPRPARARLTRRGRRLVAALVVGGGVALGVWVGPLVTSGAGDDLRLAGVSSVAVRPGDTLWSVAASVAGEEDVRAVVDRIQELNGLPGTVLVPGQVLLLP